MRVRVLLLVWGLLLALPAEASRLYPPLRQGLVLPDVTALSEEGASRRLSELVPPSAEAVLLLPVYTSCSTSCPVLIQALKQRLASADSRERVQVLLVSFDSSDTAEAMKRFREFHQLPASWRVVALPDALESKAFFEQFSYQYMKEGVDFEHPNALYLFSRDLTWVASLYGDDLEDEEFQEGLRLALTVPGQEGLLARLLARPEFLALYGLFGLLSTLVLFVLYLSRRRRGAAARRLVWTVGVAPILVATTLVGVLWSRQEVRPAAPASARSGLPPGGDFSLESASGPVSLSDHRGKVVLLFFGYTFCPDVCPTSLAEVTAVLRRLEPEEVRDVQVLFVSLDPERDEPARLRTYLSHFDERILGLTGSKARLQEAASRYNVRYQVNAPSPEGYYTVDHTASLYLVGRDGQLLEVIPYGTPARELLERLRARLLNGDSI